MPLDQDVSYSLRQMRKSPSFSCAVITTLALTVGVSTAAFSVLDAVFVRPLPYSAPERIVDVTTYSPQGYTQPASYPELLDWRKMTTGISALAGYDAWTSVNAETPAGAVALNAVRTTDNFFDVFGVKPALGRTFAKGDEQPGHNFLTVLSNEVWRESFGGKRDVIGSTVKLDGRPYIVIGVMPAGFRFPINRVNAVYFPPDMTPMQRDGRGNHWIMTIARLKAGISAAAAQQQFNAVLQQLGRAYPDTKGRRAKLVDLTTSMNGSAGAALRLLLYAVIAILAIGCVNISGMLLARGVRLQREMAVRSVLGAHRLALIRQILSENLTYAIAGAIVGVGLAYGLLHAISVLLIAALQRGSEVQINWRVLIAAVAISVLVSLLAGLVPALRLSGSSVNLVLRSGTRAGAERVQSRLRAAFVVVQVGLALVLLFTAGLVFRSLSGLRHQDFGFDPSHILTAEIDLSAGNYQKRDAYVNFYLPLLERVRAIPGVRSAGLIQMLPIQSAGWNEDVHLSGEPPNAPTEERLAEIRILTPGYYSVFGIQLVRGRFLNADIDTPNSQRVTVVNERFVERYVPKGRDPLTMFIDDGDEKVRIAGVVRNVRHWIYDPPYAEMDWPVSQIPVQMRTMILPMMHLAINTAGSPASIVPALRRVYRDVDPTLPFRTPITMQQIIADSLKFERLENWLFGAFGALAFLLAVIGIYGVISHEVQSSSRDIGVRMAVGARRWHIFSLVYRRVGWLLGVGLTAGVFVGWVARQLLNSVVQIRPEHDLGVAALVVLIFASVAALAALMPARTATRVDPIEALRTE